MPRFISIRSTACVAALVTAAPAFADVTAQDVWESWKDQIEMYGDTLTIGAETMDGNTLTIESMSIDSDEDGLAIKGTFGPFILTENGDGTVTVDMPDTMDVSFGDTEAFEANHALVRLNMTGDELVASGTPGEISYDMKVARYNLALVEAVENGTPLPFAGQLNLNDIAGSYLVKSGDLIEVTSDFTSSSADLMFSGEPEGEKIQFAYQLSGLAVKSNTALPADSDPEALEQAFLADGKVDYDLTIGQGTTLIQTTNAMGDSTMTSQSTGTDMNFALSKAGLSVGFLSKGYSVHAEGADFPFPIDLSAAEVGMGLSMPVSETKAPEPFTAHINMTEIAPNEMIWGMVDPMGALPHDPITLQLGLSGTMTVLANIMDPATQAGEFAGSPAEINSVTLDQMNVKIAGVTLTGTGGFTLDNTDLVTFSGMPRPEGNLTLHGTGINGLLDAVQSMGLPFEDQIMGARMMLGMFAKVVGDDELESTVEINAAGEVNLNGQRIK